MEEKCALSDRVSDGHVLVQFYGNHPRYFGIYFTQEFLEFTHLPTDCIEYNYLFITVLGLIQRQIFQFLRM